MQGATSGQINGQYYHKADRIPLFNLDAQVHRSACLHDLETKDDKASFCTSLSLRALIPRKGYE
jgi:hypothetical protein